MVSAEDAYSFDLPDPITCNVRCCAADVCSLASVAALLLLIWNICFHRPSRGIREPHPSPVRCSTICLRSQNVADRLGVLNHLMIHRYSTKPPPLVPHSHIVFAYLHCPRAPMRHDGQERSVTCSVISMYRETTYPTEQQSIVPRTGRCQGRAPKGS